MAIELAAHKAVHDALAANAGLAALIGGRIYDRVPVNGAVYPYLVVRMDVRDDSNTCSDASEVNAAVTVFSNTVGAQEAETIGGMVRSILAPADPRDNFTIAGYLTTVLEFAAAIYRPGDPYALTEGALAFRFLVDPL